ncbi:hypothetical protein ILUMI_21143, partial [Ignelater luminosus]
MNSIAFVLGFTIFLNFISLAFNFCDVENKDFGSSYPMSSVVYNENSLEECDCYNDGITCLRKCCPEGYVLKKKMCIRSDNSKQLKTMLLHQHRDIVLNTFRQSRFVFGVMECQRGMYKLEPRIYSDDEFYLQVNGSLWQPASKDMINHDRFCLEYFEDVGISALVCFPNEEMHVMEKVFEGVNVL